MGENKVRVRVYRDFEYTSAQLNDHPAQSKWGTWDLASDRQKAEHAAEYDRARLRGHNAYNTEIIEERQPVQQGQFKKGE